MARTIHLLIADTTDIAICFRHPDSRINPAVCCGTDDPDKVTCDKCREIFAAQTADPDIELADPENMADPFAGETPNEVSNGK